MASPALHTLLKLRRAAREESQAIFKRAEDERDAQAERLQALRDATVRGRSSIDPTDPFSLTAWHSFRMRQEVAERREVMKLKQRERDLDQKRAIHVARVRDELALQRLIEHQDAEEAAEARVREGRAMDEIASRMNPAEDGPLKIASA